MDDRRMQARGVAYGAGAGALWGLVFLAPQLVSQFGPLHLTLGRYLCYGLFSAVLIAPGWRRLGTRLGAGEWRALAWLSFSGNVAYYLLLASAVQRGGIAMTSLVIGFLPVAVSLVGSREAGALPLSRLAPSLALCVLGGLCIGGQALLAPGASRSTASSLLGLVCAIGALIAWTCYAVGNSRQLRRRPDLSVHQWNLLIGLVTAAESLLLLPLLAWLPAASHERSDWFRLGAVSIGVALLASLLGNSLWNRMSRLLPLTLVGQMILFETFFALLYGLLWERRLPTLLEALALGAVVASVMLCLGAHRRPMTTE